MRFIDLSAPLRDGMPVYPGDPPVEVRVVHTYERNSWEVRSLSMGSHSGTHVDAPSHMHEGAATLDELPVERFCGVSRLVEPEGAWPVGIGLFFALPAGLELLEKLIRHRPRFVGGELSEPLERALLAEGIVTYTDLWGLERLPRNKSFQFFGFPLRIEGGDGSPVRAVAVLDEDEEEGEGENGCETGPEADC
ncbi:cyclase family protein [Cohnella fermenti]|uniref:Cyclase family protein n=1 Tax=Cohnella fermenti TaxID=2565925 RepID=A0A4S4C0N9_9BACL|nr:cyclase family protein [Cohnella fermenti]THF81182.1 cyclase family protein [Cohnella fermenti]